MFLQPLSRDPLIDLWPNASLRRFFDDLVSPATPSPAPPFAVHADGDAVIVTAPLPGLGASELELSLEKERLVISYQEPTEVTEQPQKPGEVAAPDESAPAPNPFATRSFSKSVRLPFRADPSSVEARLERGLLEVRLVPAEEERPQRIQIR